MLTRTIKASLAGLLLSSTLFACRTIPEVHRISFSLEGGIDKPTLYLERQDKGSITLQLTPSDEVAQKATYKLVAITCPKGSILTDAHGNKVEAGIPIAMGETTWSYQPSSVGQHLLVIEVADTYGDHTETYELPVTVRHHQEVAFDVALKAEEVQLLTCHKGRLSLEISSGDYEASQLGYTIHSLHTTSGEGVFFLEDGLTPLKPGDYVHFGSQSIVFVPGL